CESGGILLGTVHGDHMIIDEVTTPTEYDKQYRCLFERMPFGHESIALARWAESNGTIRCLGEWPAPPAHYPRPSCLDRSEWNRLSAKRQDRRPLIAVIVGRKSLYVELVPSTAPGSVLFPLE